MRRSSLSFSLPLVLAVGCAHAPSADSRSSAPAPRVDAVPVSQPATPMPAGVRAVADRIIALRGLPERSPIQMQVLEPAALAAEVRRIVDAARTRENKERSRALLVAFGLVDPSVDVTKLENDLLQEQVAGLYDPVRHTLYVRSELPASALGPAAAGVSAQTMSDVVVAHEVVHALQDQAFGMPTADKLGLEGELLLSARAAFEGDATLAMGQLVADPLPRPEQLLRNVRTLQRLPREQLVKLSGQSPKLLEAPPFFMATMLFPYIDGARLAAELYAIGGFALVDRLLQHPPVSTEQVLHPEKYVAGELPVPVESPAAIAGYRVVARDTLGELGVRVLLSSCLGPRNDAGRGWGGDAATVLEGSDGSLALLWRTVWDTPEAAEWFESSLGADSMRGTQSDGGGKYCWHDSAAVPGPRPRWAVTGRAVIERRGTVVAVARGLPAELAHAEVSRLAGAPVPPVPAPVAPLGKLTLIPEGPRFRSVAAGGVWKNPGYGFSAPLLPGYETLVDTEAGQLMMKSAEGVVLVRIDEVGRPSAATLDGFIAGFRQSTAGREVTQTGAGESTAAGEKSLYRELDLTGTGHVRVTLVALCGGQGMVSITELAKSAAAQQQMNAWRDTLRREQPSPFCPAAPAH